jgi:hypothetical protein
MGLMDLPDELLFIIASTLQANGDLNSLAKSSRRMYLISNNILYSRDARRGMRALKWAAKCDMEHTARLCLSAAGPAAATCGWALPVAVEHVSETVLKLDWEVAVDPNARYNGCTALIVAVGMESMRIPDILLAANGIGPNLRDFARSHLSRAVQGGKVAVVKKLVGHARIDVDRREFGESPLFHAAIDGFADIVDLLLSHNANPNLADSRGRSPLSATAELLFKSQDRQQGRHVPGWIQVVEVLLRHPATTVTHHLPHDHWLDSLCLKDCYGTITSLVLAKRNSTNLNSGNGNPTRDLTLADNQQAAQT